MVFFSVGLGWADEIVIVSVVTKPPYEVKESGWGEFEAIIKIYFVDPAERPVTIYHHLKLFNADPLIVAGKKPLVNEYYDEIVSETLGIGGGVLGLEPLG